MRLIRHYLVPFSMGLVALATLSACGGGSDAVDPPVAPPPPPPVVVVTATHLTGTAAVGAPMTQGTLRVLDATGTVVASNITINADGTYDAGELTGTAPWRIEACGYTGANYGCIYSVAQAAGAANVTPLTTAMITLATGQSPDTIMTGSAPTVTALNAAQAQLQTGLAGTLADAGVGANFDFTTGSLAAGTRNGYDRILDAVQVTTGTDDGAFVQVTPRLGDGNLYLTQGTTTGTITTSAAAAALPLGTLESLFTKMTEAAVSATTCSDSTIGLSTLVSSDAHMSMDDSGGLNGGAQVAAGLCQFFAHGDGDAGPMWGSTFVSPVLGHCDVTGTDPLCGVSFAIQSPEGDIQDVGSGIGVVFRDNRWQFYGDLLPISINANAAVQRGVRVDDATTQAQYSRALQFDIANTTGVACAVLKTRDSAHSTFAIYKSYSSDAERMSLWMTNGEFSNAPSLDPNSGALRGSDSTWMQLPDGDDGDAVIRGFYRYGRTIDVALYSDAGCSTPATIQGKSAFPVDIDGMPPVQSALPGLAWGTLTPATVTALETFAADAGTAGSFTAAWTFADGVTGFDENTFCASGDCGDGSDSRRGQARIRPSARSGVTPLHASPNVIAAGDYKMFILGGRDASGMNVESSFFSCTSQPAGQMCGQGTTAPVDGSNGGNPGNGNGNGNGNACTDPNGCPGNSTGTPAPTGPTGPTAARKHSH